MDVNSQAGELCPEHSRQKICSCEADDDRDHHKQRDSRHKQPIGLSCTLSMLVLPHCFTAQLNALQPDSAVSITEHREASAQDIDEERSGAIVKMRRLEANYSCFEAARSRK